MPFHRLKVRIKREIVTMGQPDIDPLAAGTYVAPARLERLIQRPGTIVIDTRNDYEVAIGRFAGAIDPQTPQLSRFSGVVSRRARALLAGGRRPRVAMFCTGGIRCEKSTAFLKAEGVDDVYHLHGGILKYLETVPPEDSLWQGECFVFDQRVSGRPWSCARHAPAVPRLPPPGRRRRPRFAAVRGGRQLPRLPRRDAPTNSAPAIANATARNNSRQRAGRRMSGQR